VFFLSFGLFLTIPNLNSGSGSMKDHIGSRVAEINYFIKF
jgi:hypothetical protein